MKKTAKSILAFIIAASTVFTSGMYQEAEAYTPLYTTVKAGLYCGTDALPSANLQNVTGYGSGYQFGYLDAGRQFIPIGAATQETKITMLIDKNMVYSSSANKYEPGTTGSIVVGCYHIQLSSTYPTYNDALAAVSGYQSGYVKYSNGSFIACIGNYISADEANAAISSNGITGGSVNCGTSNTITVVATGTNKILFEFEYGSTFYLAVAPISTDGTKCQTWFKGYRYYGAFQYSRDSGGDLNVINCVELEDYVKGSIPSEMSNTWPLEALKAQAVCARSYVIANIGKHSYYDVCPTEHCQMYEGTGKANATTDAAVDQTAGQFMTYDGKLCIAYYASSNGGASENSENVWPNAVPYCRGVIDPYEADITTIAPGYSWTITYTAEELGTRLRNLGYNIGTILTLVVSEYTNTGNVYKITLTDSNGVTRSFSKGEQIRSILGVKSIRFSINGSSATSDVYVNDANSKISGGLQSSYAIGGSGLMEILGQNKLYAITGTGETTEIGKETGTQSTPGVFVIKGTGRGHNVGMSQWGAYSMAKFHNMTYDQILKYYFTGVTIG